MRPGLAKLAGDRGNISKVEQAAAAQILGSTFDSQDVARLKRGFLKDITEAIEEGEPTQVAQIIREFMESDLYDENLPFVFDTMEEYNTYVAKIGEPPAGATVKIGRDEFTFEE